MNTLYDKITQHLLNRILLCFGLRLLNNGKLVYIYRIRNYVNTDAPESTSIIKLSGDISDAFLFLNMDYDYYKKQKFQTIFEYVDWFTSSCEYLTVNLLKGIQKEIEGIEEKDRLEEHRALLRFVDAIRIGHIILKDFKFLPIFMYPNLREKIVRQYFDSEELDEQIIALKLQYAKESETQNKFSPKHVVHWIPELKKDSKLTGLVTSGFVSYITQNKTELFPRYLVDTDVNIVKQEVLSFYYNFFRATKMYKQHLATLPKVNEVA